MKNNFNEGKKLKKQLGKFRKAYTKPSISNPQQKSKNSKIAKALKYKLLERLLNLTSEIRLNVSGFAAICRKSIARILLG